MAITPPPQPLPITKPAPLILPPITPQDQRSAEAFLLALLTAGGGLTGYIRTGSIPSVVAGTGVGALVYCPPPSLLFPILHHPGMSFPPFPLSSQLFDSNILKYPVRPWWVSPPPPSTLWRGNSIGRESCAGWK